jgi:hypothetical protein
MGMDVEASLRAKLYGTAGVTNYTSGRIYPMLSPQEAKLPHITYSLISDVSHHAMVADALVREARMQVSSWSTSYSQVKGLSKAVKTALRDYSGVLATSGVTVQRIFYEGSMDMMEVDPETQAKTYHVPQDYIVWYTT